MPDFDLTVRGDVITPGGVMEGGYVAVRGGKIAAVSADKPGSAKVNRDLDGAWLFPGVIDAQVHSRSQKGQEGFAFSTKAAASGGVTTIVDMPYDEDLLVCDADSLAQKTADAEREACVDVALYGSINPAHGITRIREQIQGGVCGFKFSTFGTDPVRFPRIPPHLMMRAFAAIAPSGLAAGVHNENEEVVRYETEQVNKAKRADYLAHGLTHTDFSELLAIAEIYETGAYTGCRAHVVHCSLGRGIEICESYRRQGFDASIEVCLHYLILTEEDDVSRLGGLAKINPPIRPRREREALWSHLAAGNIDLVSTDHVAWSLSRKNNPDMLKNASGGPGLEALLPLLLKECRRRGVSLSMAARVLAFNPALHFRIGRTKGALTVGTDADFSVVDPAHAPYRVADSRTVADWSVYEGIEMPQVKATYLRGECIWDGREVLAREGFGRLVRPHAGR